jgi:hypothetical protein
MTYTKVFFFCALLRQLQFDLNFMYGRPVEVTDPV